MRPPHKCLPKYATVLPKSRQTPEGLEKVKIWLPELQNKETQGASYDLRPLNDQYLTCMIGLQCDESRPRCQRCSSFGILCNFVPGVSDLQPVADDSLRGVTTQRLPGLRPPVSNAVWTTDQSTFNQVSSRCQDFVRRYLEQSFTTPNDSNMAHVNSKLLELTFTVSNSRGDHPHAHLQC